jgi:hypothetical protein
MTDTPSAAEIKRFNDLEQWISTGYHNGKPMSEDDYERLEDERDALIGQHAGITKLARGRTVHGGSKGGGYHRPAGAGPRKHVTGSGAQSRRRAAPPKDGRGHAKRAQAGHGRPGSHALAIGSPMLGVRPRAVHKQATHTVKQAAGLLTPDPAVDVARLAWSLFTTGLGMCVLYLVLTRPKVIIDATKGISHAFIRFASPRYDLFPSNVGAALPPSAAASAPAATAPSTGNPGQSPGPGRQVSS